MSFEKGGRADKLGNKYEGWWIVKQLLRILNEEAISLTLEPIGDDERGVEFWIELKDGTKEGHQCKARNAHKEGWSISDFKSKDILKNIRFQLNRDTTHKFFFVSAVSNTLLGDICESARNSTGNAEDFYQYQMQKKGKEGKKAFNDFCNALSLDPSIPQELLLIYNYLKRIYVVFYPDNEITKQDLLREASFLFTGKPETIFSNLITYTIENNKLGQPITGVQLINFLETQTIFPKQLALDQRVLPNIKKLQTDFESSITPTLIKGQVITRPETQRCIEILMNDGLIMLTGDSGVGKSGVLYELTNKLKEDNTPYLPLRVDRRIPKNTAEQYGKDIGLPDSPVYCLGSIAKDTPAVLIIDQLDAIRWTSNHSSNALDVCKELVNQALFFKRQGIDLKIVLTCRTFDLNYDIELKNWFESKKDESSFIWETINVGLLPINTLENFIGDSYKLLNSNQKSLLARPQNLFMWLEIKDESKSTFVSSIDLMRKFWDNKLLKIEEEGISISEIMNILDKLVNFMEKKGAITAPERIIYRNSRKALNALKSNAILREQGNSLIFCHQSYLDFLIAQKVVTAIDEGGSMLDWLGTKDKQTLFRREQLRQALDMVTTESVSDFPHLAREILYSKNVRFHLKHLVLEVIGHNKKSDTAVSGLILELVSSDYWKIHLLETVFFNNKMAVQLLIDKQIIHEWLNSREEHTINTAVNLLSTVKSECPKELMKIIKSIPIQEETWKHRVLNMIGVNIETDSDEIFNIRLLLLSKKIHSSYVPWNKICSTHPERVLRYIEAILKTYKANDNHNFSKNQSNIELLYGVETKSLINIANTNCFRTWDLLFPQLIRVLSINNSDQQNLTLLDDFNEHDVIPVATKFVIEAGRRMAKDFPEELIKRVKGLAPHLSIDVKQIICKSFINLAPRFADVGIKWFLNNAKTLMQDYSINKPKHHLTRQLLKSLSPHCSKAIFKNVENFIIQYHLPNEVEFAKRVLEYRKQGYLLQYWGEPQYLLLTQLDSNRISKEASDLINVLERRYRGLTDEAVANHSYRMEGGIVKSKIEKNLFKISDNSWLKIVANKKLTSEHGKNSITSNDNSILESSIEQFSRSLERAAKHDPKRFGNLALQFPKDVALPYISAIINALALKEFIPDNEREKTWSPASSEIVLAFVNKYFLLKDQGNEIAFCRLLESREDIEWPDEVLKKLQNIALSNPDPHYNKMNIYPSDWDKSMDNLSAHDLLDNSMNCVRGVAVHAMTSLLWVKPSIFKEIENTIESITNDPHPSVRMAATKLLLPVLNIDKDKAVSWFINNAKNDLRILCTSYGTSFINYAVKSHTDDIENLIFDMLESNYKEVARRGAEMLAAYYIIHGFFTDKYSSYLDGSVPQRQGIVSGLISLLNNRSYSQTSIQLLEPFINTYDIELSKEIEKLFRHELVDIKEHVELIIKYIKSPYMTNISLLIYKLEEYNGSLLDFSNIILNLCSEVCDKYSKESRSLSSEFSFRIEGLSKLLLRLYEESMEQNSFDTFSYCLDIWDKFFENRVGSVRELTKVVEN